MKIGNNHRRIAIHWHPRPASRCGKGFKERNHPAASAYNPIDQQTRRYTVVTTQMLLGVQLWETPSRGTYLEYCAWTYSLVDLTSPETQFFQMKSITPKGLALRIEELNAAMSSLLVRCFGPHRIIYINSVFPEHR